MEIGPFGIIIILVVILLIFGPGRNAKLGRELGAGIRQFRQGLDMSLEPDKDDEKEFSFRDR